MNIRSLTDEQLRDEIDRAVAAECQHRHADRLVHARFARVGLRALLDEADRRRGTDLLARGDLDAMAADGLQR